MSSAEEKKKYVLFSPIGDTDPIRGGFDGPMLHIVRHYKPEKVYLFLTQTMSERDSQHDFYQKSIDYLFEKGYLKHKCEVKKFDNNHITNPSDFDVFYKFFDEHIDQILADNPGVTILLNASSGTPQINATVCLKFVSRAQSLLLVQVTNPQKTTGKDIPHFDFEFKFNPSNEDKSNDELLRDELENNFDNYYRKIPEIENRCVQPTLFGFKKDAIKHQIKALIKNYDYQAAHSLMREEGNAALFSDRVKNYLEHAYYRSMPNDEEARKFAGADFLDAMQEMYPSSATEMYEYYLNMKTKSERGEITDFLLRLKPFAEYLAKKFLEGNGAGLATMATQRRLPREDWYINENLAENNHPGIMMYLDKAYGGYFYANQSIDNLTTMIHIMNFKKFDTNIVNVFWGLEAFMSKRNAVAHKLVSATEKDIEEIQQGGTSKHLCEMLEKLIRSIYKNIPKRSDFFNKYEQINQRIIEEMDRPLEIAKSEGD